MRKILALAVVFLIGFISCKEESKKTPADSTAVCKTSLNPNGDSELALLMRELAAFTDSVKQDLLNNRELRPRPENINTILSAKKTDENIDKSIYDPLARSYITGVDYFYSSKPEDRKENYNSMVNNCIACHQNFCGGPIKRIQKLLVK
ncbi:hypothetical protein BH11BAC7_BH11BAC7_19700 [soil metagenome]